MTWAQQNEVAAQALASARFTTSTGFARADCPFCAGQVGRSDRKQCLAINVRTGWWRCWKCRTQGRLGGFDQVGTEDRQCTVGAEPPEGYLPLCEEPAASALSADAARSYLRGRGLTDERVWDEAEIGVVLTGRWANRVVVPVVSSAGEWWGWTSRLWSRGARNPHRHMPGMVLGGGLYNHRALLEDTEAPLILVEAVFDALPYWPDAVACLGKPRQAQVRSLVESGRPVAVALDGDAWEEGEMLALRLQFEGRRAAAVRLPPKEDPNSVDPGWLREEVRRCL